MVGVMDSLFSVLRAWFEALLMDLGFGPDEEPSGLVVTGNESVDLVSSED